MTRRDTIELCGDFMRFRLRFGAQLPASKGDESNSLPACHYCVGEGWGADTLKRARRRSNAAPRLIIWTNHCRPMAVRFRSHYADGERPHR